MHRTGSALLGLLLAVPPGARAADPPPVVINEILYHAPNDLDALQFVELHNPGAQAVDLSGWKLGRGVRFTFPDGTRLAPGGYLVLCKDKKEFQKHYGGDAYGPFTGSLGHGGARLELTDAAGTVVDAVTYGTRAPWPVSADGSSSSLERICPTSPGDSPDNWAASPLSDGPPKPGGTPGKRNSVFSPHLPPTIAKVVVSPSHAAPGQAIRVTAEVRSAETLRAVEVRYRVAESGRESPESAVALTKDADGRYSATIPGQRAGKIVRLWLRATDDRGGDRTFPHANDLRPALSVYVHEPFVKSKNPLGFIVNVGTGGRRAAGFLFSTAPGAPPPRGSSAYVHVDPRTGEPTLYDFVTISPRNGGVKVRFPKDRPLDGMTTINLIYEGLERWILDEALSYEVYRKAGVAAPRTDFVRLTVDGRPQGYQLLIEQPNKSFLRRNGLRTDGNLYKILWYAQGVVDQHEKKTCIQGGHEDVSKLVERLNATKGAEQWDLIQKAFDVEQVASYFAVNMVLSHWDGYFNNYFTYHDVHGSGKWTMYPWDQDKAWGYHDGLGEHGIFTDMPLTFGMAGDRPLGTIWWRQAGYFSGPLLANPEFRKRFLVRTKEILDKIYTPEVFFPLVAAMGERLEEEVVVRAKLHGGDGRDAKAHLERNLRALREHLTKRRQFLLAQAELKEVGKQ